MTTPPIKIGNAIFAITPILLFALNLQYIFSNANLAKVIYFWHFYYRDFEVSMEFFNFTLLIILQR